jgi:cytochrome b
MIWSVIHFFTSVIFGWLMNPLVALMIVVLWEPFEVLFLSPLLAKRGILFGHESIRNTLSDIVFDCLGVAVGYYLLTEALTPPFNLF